MDKGMIPKRWTEEELQLVQKLAQEGKSGSAIGKILGRSRNAVIGVMHRNKITHNRLNKWVEIRMTKPKPKSEPKVKLKRQFILNTENKEPDYASIPADPPDRKNYVPFLDRKYNQCKFIIEKKEDTYFCCGGTVSKKGWCKFHAAIVYRPPDPRRSGNDPDKEIRGPSK